MTRSDDERVTSVVLAGGASRRMGSPKAMLRVPEHGPTMLERVVNVVQARSDQVLLVGTALSVFPPELADMHVVIDAGAGPVGGLIAALGASDHSTVFVTACDLPFLSEDVVRLVVRRSVDLRCGVCPAHATTHGPETLQPLVAAYRRDDVEEITALHEAGEQSLIGIVKALNMAILPPVDTVAVDPDHWSFFNVNTRADLDVARRHATSG